MPTSIAGNKRIAPGLTPRTPHPAGPGRRHGFTLIELLIALAVIAVAATLVMPGIGRLLLPRYAPPPVDQFIAALARIRDEAILHRQPFRGYFNLSEKRLENADGLTRLTLPDTLTAEKLVTATEKPPPDKQVAERLPCLFRIDGSGCGQTLLLTDGALTWRIVIDPITGRIRGIPVAP